MLRKMQCTLKLFSLFEFICITSWLECFNVQGCIGGIFELRMLGVQGLCTITRTSACLADIAGEMFRRRYRTSNIHLGHGLSWSLPSIKSLFLSFGAHIRWLHLYYPGAFGEVLLGFVTAYCPNIEEFLPNSAPDQHLSAPNL